MILDGALALLLALAGCGPGSDQPEPTPEPVEAGGRVFELFPATDYYPPNTASPHQLANSVQLLAVGSVGIASSGDQRFGLRLGGRFGVLRIHPRGDEQRGWQIGIDAGFYGQFDNDHSQDNIGWDGFYGATLTRGQGRLWAWKVGLFHTSAHVGDEYAERTERRRIGYTREELQAGVSLQLTRRLRTYLEGAYGYTGRSELQAPWRAQTGLVLEDGERFAGGRFGWYAGTDLSSWEERDWRLDLALQAGLLLPAGDRAWRFGLEYYDGRPPMGEFFQDTESYTALGLWLDL